MGRRRNDRRTGRRQEFLRLPYYVEFFPRKPSPHTSRSSSVGTHGTVAAAATGMRVHEQREVQLGWLLGGASASVIDLMESQRADHWLLVGRRFLSFSTISNW